MAKKQPYFYCIFRSYAKRDLFGRVSS